MSKAAAKQIHLLRKRDGNRCCYCLKNLGTGTRRPPTREHRLPKSLGGPDHLTNLLLACADCNVWRQCCDFETWMALCELIRDEKKRQSLGAAVVHRVRLMVVALVESFLGPIAEEDLPPKFHGNGRRRYRTPKPFPKVVYIEPGPEAYF